MFQVLEHMDDLDAVFRSLRDLTAPEAWLFISVPNGASVDQQEELTGFHEMPPAHVGMWYPESFRRIVGRHGFEIDKHEVEPSSQVVELWRLAMSRVAGRAYATTGIPARVYTLPRLARGALKRAMAVGEAARLSPHLGNFHGQSQWVALRKTASSGASSASLGPAQAR